MDILTLHPLVAGGSHLVEKLMEIREIDFGLKLIDENKHTIDNHFFETLKKKIEEEKGK